MAEKLLVACADGQISDSLAACIRGMRFQPVFASTVQESVDVLAKEPIALVFCEDALPGGGFPELLEGMKELGEGPLVVVVSRTGEWREYAKALRFGAFDMIIPPFDQVMVEETVSKALCEYAPPLVGDAASSRMGRGLSPGRADRE